MDITIKNCGEDEDIGTIFGVTLPHGVDNPITELFCRIMAAAEVSGKALLHIGNGDRARLFEIKELK